MEVSPVVETSAMFLSLLSVLPFFALLTLLPLGLYVLARWQDSRASVADSQLGFKFALHLFRLSAYQLFLVGLFFLLVVVLERALAVYVQGSLLEVAERTRSMLIQTVGVLIPAGLVFSVCAWVLTRTNQQSYPALGRLFSGYNLVITGIAGFVALIMLFQKVFWILFISKVGKVDTMPIAFSLVYTTAWIIHGFLFGRRILKASAQRN